jgi:hypothetical protein
MILRISHFASCNFGNRRPVRDTKFREYFPAPQFPSPVASSFSTQKNSVTPIPRMGVTRLGAWCDIIFGIFLWKFFLRRIVEETHVCSRNMGWK